MTIMDLPSAGFITASCKSVAPTPARPEKEDNTTI
jgi:hypothetical protein